MGAKRILLAPMEGVLDVLLRNLLSAINDYDLCITEFVRVVDRRLPEKVFYRLCPELSQQSRTPSGTRVRVQLLGQHPDWLAENAERALELGSWGVDFNCGCPSKTVNGSGGGASLLKEPELIYQAVSAIRHAVPDDFPVSVKVRLGWQDTHQKFEIADAVQQGGATEIVVHGRTKTEGYCADRINWSAIGDIRQHLQIPVIANGEILDWASAQQCMLVTGCHSLMLGRGALCTPNLSRVIKYHEAPMSWGEVLQLLDRYIQLEKKDDTGLYHVARIKQWLGYLRKSYPQAGELFRDIRSMMQSADIARAIERAYTTYYCVSE